MGYDIHVTRAQDWHSNQGKEILGQEWLDLVQNDPELTLDPQNGRYSVLWAGPESPSEAWFDWYKGNIYTTNPDRAVLQKAIDIASYLGATVQGDDGRVYQTADDYAALPQTT